MRSGRLPRPDRLAVVAGTGTDVGKTWVAVHLLRRLRASGVAAAARKPAQSFEPGTPPTDAEALAEATGEAPTAVCPDHRSYPVAMAPPMATEVLGLPPFTIGELVREVEASWPPGLGIGLVESVGGVRSPVADDGDTVTLCCALGPDVIVLVADAGLGTINAVRLSCGALANAAAPIIVHLNRYDEGDELHRRNRSWLEHRDGFAVTVSIPDLAERVLDS